MDMIWLKAWPVEKIAQLRPHLPEKKAVILFQLELRGMPVSPGWTKFALLNHKMSSHFLNHKVSDEDNSHGKLVVSAKSGQILGRRVINQREE